jgi:hypothetical protein
MLERPDIYQRRLSYHKEFHVVIMIVMSGLMACKIFCWPCRS